MPDSDICIAEYFVFGWLHPAHAPNNRFLISCVYLLLLLFCFLFSPPYFSLCSVEALREILLNIYMEQHRETDALLWILKKRWKCKLKGESANIALEENQTWRKKAFCYLLPFAQVEKCTAREMERRNREENREENAPLWHTFLYIFPVTNTWTYTKIQKPQGKAFYTL